MEQKNWSNWVPFFLLALTAYWGYEASLSKKLTSVRPTKDDWKDVSLIGDQFVPARLWQDPFEAVKQSISLGEPHQHPGELVRQAQSWGKKIRVIGIFTEGHPYPEDREVRLRFRYAVQMAMAGANFRPADRNFIGVVTVPWVAGHELRTNFDLTLQHAKSYTYEPKSGSTNSLAIPFEWFISDGSKDNAPILVMWLREEAFSDLPNKRLHLLMDGFLSNIGGSADTINFLGPRSSDTLKEFLAESSTNWPPPPFRLFSCQATAPDRILNQRCSKILDLNSERPFLKEEMKKRGIELTNCIANDDRFAREIMEELDRRDFIFNGFFSSDRIAIINEVDTTYGRALQTIFKNAFIEKNIQKCGKREDAANRVIEAGYLRGLDGAKANVNPIESKQQPEILSLGNGSLDPAQGENQMDYARRLARKLKIVSLESKQNGKGEIHAIGILGSDTYDKLILIQALRTEFEDAILFTTDMDARLLEPSANHWARNVIVASPFSLDIRGKTLSFRDSYQTALYRACRMAIGDSFPEPSPSPVLYELGRDRGVKLPLPSDEKVEESFSDAMRRCWWWMRGLGLPFLIAFLGLAGMLGLLRSVARCYYGSKIFMDVSLKQTSHVKQKNEIYHGRFEALSKSIVCSLIVVVASAGVAAFDNTRDNGEPLALFQGTSVWPTIVIRFIAVGFSTTAIIWAWHTYKTRLFDIKENCQFKSELLDSCQKWENLKAQNKGWWELLKFRRHQASITQWPVVGKNVPDPEHPESNHSQLNIEELFTHYQKLGRFNTRVYRVLPIAAALFCLCLGILLATGGGILRSPFRGSISHAWDVISLALTIGSMMLLMSYVVDVARLAERFIKRLGSGVTIWPDTLAKQWTDRTKLSDAQVSGLLDVRFVADFTSHISVIFYFPFVMICLLLLSRSFYFDRWPWPFGLKFIFVLNCILAFVCSWCIRSAATKVKADAMQRLALEALAYSEDAGKRDRIVRTAEYISNIRSGAYASWLHDPSFIGALVPTGGAGLIAAIRALLGY